MADSTMSIKEFVELLQQFPNARTKVLRDIADAESRRISVEIIATEDITPNLARVSPSFTPDQETRIQELIDAAVEKSVIEMANAIREGTRG